MVPRGVQGTAICKLVSTVSLATSLKIWLQRFDGMKDYKMAQVISATPILLHAALMCFSIGLVDFLWTLNQIVAIPVNT